jgi:hypothetical protein
MEGSLITSLLQWSYARQYISLNRAETCLANNYARKLRQDTGREHFLCRPRAFTRVCVNTGA